MLAQSVCIFCLFYTLHFFLIRIRGVFNVNDWCISKCQTEVPVPKVQLIKQVGILQQPALLITGIDMRKGTEGVEKEMLYLFTEQSKVLGHWLRRTFT